MDIAELTEADLGGASLLSSLTGAQLESCESYEGGREGEKPYACERLLLWRLLRHRAYLVLARLFASHLD
jgi:hypothetical protein